LPCPGIRLKEKSVPPAGRWLVKPSAGSGGAGIRFWRADRPDLPPRKPTYWQEYVEGQACAAVYVGDEHGARLLGVTRQLVGEPWLHASPFQYCGSIGPLLLTVPLRRSFERLGMALAFWCGLRGLFGVDCILRDDVPWAVEVNPRYTASVEVLEYATGVPALALHRHVFDDWAPEPELRTPGEAASVVGKAILFARAPLVVPGEGPWSAALRQPAAPWELPGFADIPHSGEQILAGRPVLTFFARADSEAACLQRLWQTAEGLDRLLFGG
jgi:uncharacterized protein